MADPILGPDRDFEQNLRDIESRLRALESGTPQQRMTLQDGLIRILDNKGRTRAQIGRLNAVAGGEEFGIEVVSQPGDSLWTDGKPFFRATGDGAEFPYAVTAFVPADITYIPVTSSFFVDVLATATPLIEHKYVATLVPVQTDGSTTAEIRIQNRTTGISSPAVAVPVSTNAYVEVPAWAHGSQLWQGPISFSVQARVVTGASLSVGISKYGLRYIPR